MPIFPPNWLKIYKIAKKRLNIIRLRHAPSNHSQFNFVKNYKSRRGGGKDTNLKFNIHPWNKHPGKANKLPLYTSLVLLPLFTWIARRLLPRCVSLFLKLRGGGSAGRVGHDAGVRCWVDAGLSVGGGLQLRRHAPVEVGVPGGQRWVLRRRSRKRRCWKIEV